MELKTVKPNYEIATGDHDFAGIQVSHENDTIGIQLEYTGLDAADAKAVIMQSIDNSGLLSPMTDTEVTLDQAKAGHVWNLAGVARGSFVNVRIIKGAATAGTVTKIQYVN
jgi:hypothetical protein